MKIAAKAVREFLLQPDKGCAGVLFYGPDGGLVRERMQQAAAFITGPAPDPFARVELSEDALKHDPAQLADALGAMSLLGGRCVVIVRGESDKLGKMVEAALGVADGQHYLIVCAEELGPRSALRQLFEGHARLAAVPCYKDEAMDLGTVIRQKLEAAGIHCSRDAMAYLQQHLGNDRYVTYGELEKIILYLGEERTLTLETAQALVGHHKDMSFEGLSMELAAGAGAGVEALLSQALREGAQPVALLRSAQKYFQKLYGAREAMDGGKPADAVVAALRPPLFFRLVPVFTRQLQDWPRPALAGALGVLAAAELAVKQAGVSPALVLRKAYLDVLARRPGGR